MTSERLIRTTILLFWVSVSLYFQSNLMTAVTDDLQRTAAVVDTPPSASVSLVVNSQNSPRHAATVRGGGGSKPTHGKADATSINTHELEPRVVQWLQVPELERHSDLYSATFLVNKDTFLNFDLDSINYVEATCFKLFWKQLEKVQMTLDWFDFSVEHMSKWWRILGVPEYEYVFERVLSILDNYRMERMEPTSMSAFDPSFLQPTIALISFRQYREDKNENAAESRKLTISSLGATISSLVQAGMGRLVVVTCCAEEDEAVVNDTFNLFSKESLRGTELVFVRVSEEMTKSKLDPVNIPKACLVGLRQAMLGDDKEWTRAWMGEDPLQWKYVYMTEPDTLINTRPSALRYIWEALETGQIVVPHRLQPIPYEGDVPHSKREKSFLPLDFKKPYVLDALAGDACCDEQAGKYKPGLEPYVKKCASFWWECGFATKSNHSRLEPYDFMRLKQGSGVVNLAGTEHGRRCIPKKQGRCERKMSTNHPDHPDNPRKDAVE